MRVFSNDDPFGALPDNVTNSRQKRIDPPGGDYPSTAWFQNVKPDDPNFSRVLDRAGRPIGLGFFCRKCSLEIRHSATSRVFHCGREETAPENTSRLPERQL
jgi:hypothetical protein